MSQVIKACHCVEFGSCGPFEDMDAYRLFVALKCPKERGGIWRTCRQFTYKKRTVMVEEPIQNNSVGEVKVEIKN